MTRIHVPEIHIVDRAEGSRSRESGPGDELRPKRKRALGFPISICFINCSYSLLRNGWKAITTRARRSSPPLHDTDVNNSLDSLAREYSRPCYARSRPSTHRAPLWPGRVVRRRRLTRMHPRCARPIRDRADGTPSVCLLSPSHNYHHRLSSLFLSRSRSWSLLPVVAVSLLSALSLSLSLPHA